MYEFIVFPYLDIWMLFWDILSLLKPYSSNCMWMKEKKHQQFGHGSKGGRQGRFQMFGCFSAGIEHFCSVSQFQCVAPSESTKLELQSCICDVSNEGCSKHELKRTGSNGWYQGEFSETPSNEVTCGNSCR